MLPIIIRTLWTHGPHVEPHASPALGTCLHHPWTSPGHHLVSKSNAHFASITLPDLSEAYGKLMFPYFETPFPLFPWHPTLLDALYLSGSRPLWSLLFHYWAHKWRRSPFFSLPHPLHRKSHIHSYSLEARPQGGLKLGRSTLIRYSDLIYIKWSSRICIFNKPPEVPDSWALYQLPTQQWVQQWRADVTFLPAPSSTYGLSWTYKHTLQIAAPSPRPLLSLPHLINHQTLLSLLSASGHFHCHFPSLNQQSLASVLL